MTSVYTKAIQTQVAVSSSYFEKRLARLELALHTRFVLCAEPDQLADLLQEARVYLWQAYRDEPEVMERSGDDYWIDLALRGVLRLNETQSLFERQFAVIERHLHHWARQRFAPDIVEDVVQGAYIDLWEDYQRHQHEWDERNEAFWVACGKLAMKASHRALKSQTHQHKGSSRKRKPQVWVQQIVAEYEFPRFEEDGDEEERNDLLDQLSQLDDVDWHGCEVQLANLRIDLERLLTTARQHYSAKTFARCQLLLERLVEGYTRAEIRLELGWSESTYDFTMSLIRDMAQFADGYQRAPGRSAKMSQAELTSIERMHRAGYSQPEIARLVGRDRKTVWRVLQQAQ